MSQMHYIKVGDEPRSQDCWVMYNPLHPLAESKVNRKLKWKKYFLGEDIPIKFKVRIRGRVTLDLRNVHLPPPP